MENPAYRKQVELLLRVLPEVAKEPCFALHGGTAINLFLRNMPRLSVDIDLTYIDFEDREMALANISDALKDIAERIINVIPGVRVEHKRRASKLQMSKPGATIKLEVNQTTRGVLGKTNLSPVCDRVQEEFDVFVFEQVLYELSINGPVVWRKNMCCSRSPTSEGLV